MIKSTKIKGSSKIELPKKGAFTIETDPDFIKLHTMMLLSGKRGGGKSVAVANIIKQAKDKGYYDKIWLITPTYHSNSSIWDIAGIEMADVFEPSKTVLRDIIKMVEAEKEEWDTFEYKKLMFENYQRDMNNPLSKIRDSHLLDYLNFGFFEGVLNPPKWKYKNEVPPRLGVIIDDCMGTALMLPSAGLTNFCIKMRHVGKGVGISIFMLVQSYCSAVGTGIARPIRENCTHLCLFKCKDEAQIKKISTEIGADIDLEQFTKLYEYATAEPFGYLLIDFAPKDPTKIFRKNFNEFITINDIPETQS